MEQRLSLVTLGVADLEAARRFYEALGWTQTPRAEGVVFFQAGCISSPSGIGVSSERTAA